MTYPICAKIATLYLKKKDIFEVVKGRLLRSKLEKAFGAIKMP